MTTANEIQQLALDVFENKLDYKDNDFICVMNILKESYMKAKGLVNDKEGEKVVDTYTEAVEEGVEEAEETDDEYFLRTHRYENYYSDDGSDSAYDSSSYLSPY